MQRVFASLSVLLLAGCAAPVPAPPANAAVPSAPVWMSVTRLVPVKPPPSTPPWTPVKPLVLAKPAVRDSSRLPLPGDVDVAWDKLDHRGQVRWECRATPSGQFVKQSFCAHRLQLEGPRPASFANLEGWTGVIYND